MYLVGWVIDVLAGTELKFLSSCWTPSDMAAAILSPFYPYTAVAGCLRGLGRTRHWCHILIGWWRSMVIIEPFYLLNVVGQGRLVLVQSKYHYVWMVFHDNGWRSL